MSQTDQVLLLGKLAQARVRTGRFAPRDIEDLFVEFALPPPANVSQVLARLKAQGLATRPRGRGAAWCLTPKGRHRSVELMNEEDLLALVAEGESGGVTLLGNLTHPLLPPALAPPEAVLAIKEFLAEHPFETNVFGMTRFPEDGDGEESNADPLQPALNAAGDACGQHGLKFHLASDGSLADDLWTNVSAYMWASKFGIAFFEDRAGRGINYNMSIEVGAMLMGGRRCALLKDTSVTRMPTDLVGRIYKSVDVHDPSSVSIAVHMWLRDDLRLGACSGCP